MWTILINNKSLFIRWEKIRMNQWKWKTVSDLWIHLFKLLIWTNCSEFNIDSVRCWAWGETFIPITKRLMLFKRVQCAQLSSTSQQVGAMKMVVVVAYSPSYRHFELSADCSFSAWKWKEKKVIIKNDSKFIFNRNQ